MHASVRMGKQFGAAELPDAHKDILMQGQLAGPIEQADVLGVARTGPMACSSMILAGLERYGLPTCVLPE